jgi:hypothetical protein
MSLVFLGVFFSALIGLSSSFAEPASHFRSSTGWNEWTDPIRHPCTLESLSVSAITRVLSNITSDGAGGYHYQFQFALRGTAVGEDTGNGYAFNETQNYEYNEPAGGVYQHTEGFIALYRSLDKDEPDVRIHLNIVFTHDASGNVRVDIIHLDSNCEPL